MVTYDQIKIGDIIGVKDLNGEVGNYGKVLDKHKGKLRIEWIHYSPYWNNMRTLFGQKPVE